MIGQTVQVRFPVEGEPDWSGNTVMELGDPVEVENVLVAPGEVADVTDSNRPDGVEVQQTLYFPKAYAGPSLKDAEVDAGLGFLKVIGVPSPYPPHLTPTDWNMTVKVGRIDG
jgi:hypothetical protein